MKVTSGLSADMFVLSNIERQIIPLNSLKTSNLNINYISLPTVYIPCTNKITVKENICSSTLHLFIHLFISKISTFQVDFGCNVEQKLLESIYPTRKTLLKYCLLNIFMYILYITDLWLTENPF